MTDRTDDFHCAKCRKYLFSIYRPTAAQLAVKNYCKEHANTATIARPANALDKQEFDRIAAGYSQKPIAYIDAGDLAELRKCQGMSLYVWLEPVPDDPQPSNQKLVPLYGPKP